MNTIDIKGTEDTPSIILDKANGKFELSGRSLPEDAATFYAPILQWLTEYSSAPNPSTEFVVKLEYFNTASSKLLLDVLMKVEVIKGAKVSWYFDKDDEDMEEAGQEFSELVSIPFEFKKF